MTRRPRPMRPRSALRWAPLLSLLSVAACASGPRFDGRVLHGEHTTYRVGALPGYSRTEAPDSDLAFHHPTEGVVGVQGTCGDYDDVPAQALANHLLFGTTHRQYLVDEEAKVDGRMARHQLVRAQLDGADVELELYVLVKNGCVFDLTHARRPTAPPEARAHFTAFVADFAVLWP